MYIWSIIRRLCIYGLLCSAALSLGFWFFRAKQIEDSANYHTDVVVPAIERAKRGEDVKSGKMPEVITILGEHIKNQAKAIEADSNFRRSVIFIPVFALGLIICRLQLGNTRRKEDRELTARPR